MKIKRRFFQRKSQDQDSKDNEKSPLEKDTFHDSKTQHCDEPQEMKLHSIKEAIQDIKNGKIIIVVDDENRENEGDFVMAAEKITPEAINFMATYGKGLICTPMSEELSQHFELPLQSSQSSTPFKTAFTITIDAKNKISTGISALDRSHTIKLLTEESSRKEDFVSPGHIFPLISRPRGVFERPGHTEASVDLSVLAGLKPVSVICEIMNPNGTMARLPELIKMAKDFDLKIISIEDLIKYRVMEQNLISAVENAPLPTQFGDFQIHTFKSDLLQEEHVALVKGNLTSSSAKDPCLVRIHSECFTGDVLKSLRCDCGEQLEKSLEMIEEAGRGLIIYLRQEGRGIGLFNKIKAYKLQDLGRDTVEANEDLGFPIDLRNYSMAYQILKYFDLEHINLLTNNPQKIDEIQSLGIRVSQRIPLEITPHQSNKEYLKTKKQKLGHFLHHKDLH